MFLHLLIAAALLSPAGSTGSATAPTAAMVCSIAAEIHAVSPGARRAVDTEHGGPHAPPAPNARPMHQNGLTTQLRR